jgi:AmmeMemoRadiSam system protein B
MSEASIRQPAVAGRFYPAASEQCRQQAASFLRYNTIHAQERKWIGGIVPHAGWICSGAIAGETIATLAAVNQSVDVVVVFGAIHYRLERNKEFQLGAFDSHAQWAMPGGVCSIRDDLQRALAEKKELFVVEERLHQREHAVEVNVPLIQLAFPNAAVLPIEVGVTENAAEIGRNTAARVAKEGLKAVYLASSDLTHYGTNYEFVPAGVGVGAMNWAKQNDQRVLNLVAGMQSERIISEVRQHHNACGPGAIVAMMEACRVSGAGVGKVLRHATSYETLAEVAPQPPTNAVGYASVVVG